MEALVKAVYEPLAPREGAALHFLVQHRSSFTRRDRAAGAPPAAIVALLLVAALVLLHHQSVHDDWRVPDRSGYGEALVTCSGGTNFPAT